MRLLRGERGLAPALLVIVIAWALAAVLMLTGTILSAQRIERDVGSIVGSTSSIDNDLDSIRLAKKTTRISEDILTAAEPLVGQLDQVVVSARSIDREARSILDNAEEINGDVFAINDVAGSINDEVHSINATAGSINETVTSILGNARDIESTAGSINASAGSINASVQSIGGSVVGINGRLGGTLNEGRTIDVGVAGINVRASRAIRRVAPIRSDLIDVLDQVGRPPGAAGHDGGTTIHGHANSIDCEVSRALRILPPNTNTCGQ